jgi:hypothetical protein
VFTDSQKQETVAVYFGLRIFTDSVLLVARRYQITREHRKRFSVKFFIEMIAETVVIIIFSASRDRHIRGIWPKEVSDTKLEYLV